MDFHSSTVLGRSLASSKYAQAGLRQSAPELPSHALATKEQLMMSSDADGTSRNPGAQLALTQDHKLSEEVKHHISQYVHSVSDKVTNTRSLLVALRESLNESRSEAVASLVQVEKLWNELEQLFKRAIEAESSFPKFMASQKDNYSLYHSGGLPENRRQTYAELNTQREKIDRQDSLLIGQQRAAVDYEATTDSKLEELADLQDRVSRLTLDKGLLKTELGKAKEDLGELTELKVRNEALRGSLDELQNKVKIIEREIVTLNETLIKEKDQRRSLEDVVCQHKDSEHAANMELEGLKALRKVDQQKYSEVSTECAKTSKASSRIPAKGLHASRDINNEQDYIDLKNSHQSLTEKVNQQVAQLQNLEAEIAAFVLGKVELEKQIEGLQHNLEERTRRLENTKAAMGNTITKLRHEKDDLELENNELIAKQSELKRSVNRIVTLESELQQLRASHATNQDAAKSQASVEYKSMALERQSLEQQFTSTKVELQQLQKKAADWQNLAGEALGKFKTQVKANAELDAKNKKEREELLKDMHELRAKLQTTQANVAQPPKDKAAADGGDGDQSAKHWKRRYDELLQKLTGITAEK